MEQSLLQEDNQQESIETIKELSWLGGIIDGEGTISIVYHARKNQSPFITPVITITNTNRVMIDEIIRIYTKYNIPHWTSHRKAIKTWSESWEIQIKGLKRCSKSIPKILPYLVNKSPQCKVVNNWINYRLSLLGKHSDYSEIDFKAVKEIREFNKKGNNYTFLLSSETIR